MRDRAIKDLAQLSDAELFKMISIGYEQVLNHALYLDTDAQALGEQGHIPSNRVLAIIAQEEAAKCLILLDAVRCPRSPSKLLAAHLSKFYSHLAKGLYEESCWLTIPTFGECTEYVEAQREAYYLEMSNNGVEVTLPNRLTSDREGILYVDYVKLESGKHIWLIPNDGEFWKAHTPFALDLVKFLYDAGCTSPDSLALIASFWRPRILAPSFTLQELFDLNHQLLGELDSHSLLQEQPKRVYDRIIDAWAYPMFSLDMQMSKVSGKK